MLSIGWSLLPEKDWWALPVFLCKLNPIKAHWGKGSWPFFFERLATSPPQADHVLVDLFSFTADGGLCGQSSPTLDLRCFRSFFAYELWYLHTALHEQWVSRTIENFGCYKGSYQFYSSFNTKETKLSWKKSLWRNKGRSVVNSVVWDEG